MKKSLKDIPSFIAGDKTLLKEVLHPKNDAVSLPYSLAYATIAPGEQSLSHALMSSEVYFILEGSGTIHIGNKTYEIAKGDTIHVPAAESQYVMNTGSTTLEFLCIVAPAWKEQEEEIFDK